MTARIALISPPVPLEERYGAFAGSGSTQPSFGLACLAAAVRAAGFSPVILDASAADWGVERTLEEALRSQPDVVGFTSTTSGILAVAELARRLKERRPGVFTVVGGCHATALPEDTLQSFPALDAVVYGEGEVTLVELLRGLAAGGAPLDLPGTVVRAGGQIRRNPPRPLIADLDSLPLPAWDLIPGFPRAFRPSPGRIRRWPCASVVLTRGCPNQCVFCDRSVFGNRCRSMSAEYAVRLLEDLRRTYGVREVLIEDDTFVIVPERVRAFCEQLLARRLGLSWSCLGRADRVTPELLTLMKRAGCWHISYGVESGDPGILAAMHKRLDLDQIRRAVEWSRAAGLRTKGFFIVGFPGETADTLEATRRLACSLALDEISVMHMTPFPGSELYETAGKFGRFDCDWKRMNVLETVFVPEGLTEADLEAAHVRMLRSFYMRPGVLARHGLYALRHPRVLLDMGRGVRTLAAVLLRRAGRTGGPTAPPGGVER